MSSRKLVAGALGAGIMVAVSGAAWAADGPKLGRKVSEQELKDADISIPPDGSGLPAGSGTSARGAQVYAEKCQSCHGEKGAGRPHDRLVGGEGTLAGPQPAVRTVGSYWPYATTVFDYIRRSMPLTAPLSLSNDEVYAVTAYVLQLNGIIKEGDEMNAQTLPKVQMPNRVNFINAYTPPAPPKR